MIERCSTRNLNLLRIRLKGFLLERTEKMIESESAAMTSSSSFTKKTHVHPLLVKGGRKGQRHNSEVVFLPENEEGSTK